MQFGLKDMPEFTFSHFLISLVVSFIWGFVCMHFAKKKGRDPRAWFVLGLFFTVFALAILLLVPSQKVMEAVALAKAEALKEAGKLKESLNPLKTTLDQRKWYYLNKNQKPVGPVDLKTLKEEKLKGSISSSTYLWSEGMLDWQILEKLFYLRTELE